MGRNTLLKRIFAVVALIAFLAVSVITVFPLGANAQDAQTKIKNSQAKQSELKDKIKNDRMFSLEKYIIDFIIMVFVLMVIIPLAFSCIEQVIEIIKVFACPDVLVFDYIMEHYLNYTH